MKRGMTTSPTPPFQPAACVCCRLSRESCDVPFISGEAVSVESGDAKDRTLQLRTEEREWRILLPADSLTEWQEAILSRAFAMAKKMGRGVRIGFMHLAETAEGLRFSANSLFVLEPDWLFSVSDATHFDFCDRQRLVALYRSEPANLPLIRGTLVHELFPAIWNGADETQLEAALVRAVEGQAVKIGLAGLNPAEVAESARPHLARLRRWAAGLKKQSDLVSETFRLSPGWGLKGRIDAIWERPGSGPLILGELKTGRSRGRSAVRGETGNGEAELGHIFQLVSYAAMLAGRDEIVADPLHACLLYSGNPEVGGKLDIVRKVELTVGQLRDTVDIRNRLVLIEMGDAPAYKTHPAACNKCRCNSECETVGRLAGHADPRPLKTAAWDRTGSAQLEEADAACFRHYETRIRAELEAVRGEMARLWNTKPEARVAEGRALRLQGEGRLETAETGEGRRTLWRYGIEGGNHSEFRAGDSVLLSDHRGPAAGRAALGTVAEAGPDDIAVAWESEPGLKPAWVDGYPDEKLTQRQVRALFRFLSRPSRLKDVLIRQTRPPEFDSQPVELAEWLGAESLKLVKENAGQREAVTMALRTKDILLVAGPPGSGKTRLIGAMVEAILKRDPATRVLLVAATNRALDQAMEKIMTPALADVAAVRLGGDSVVSDRVRPLTPAARAEAESGVEAKAAVAGEAVRAARVAGVTASTLAGGALDAVLGSFGWVVMDEASQMTVPLGLGAASYGERLILIGDDRQLPPIARAADAGTGEWPGLSVSLFALARERLAGTGPILVELERQYRMSEGVGAAPAAVWYAGRLRPGSRAVADRRLVLSSNWEQHPMAAALDPERPVRVMDIPGGMRPRVHDGEAAWVAAFLAALENCGALPVAPGEEAGGVSVAVISPFRAQVARIRTVLGAAFPERRARWRLCVDTVDRFQGGEADVVVVSLCPPAEMSDHLADPRRLNVAITRARSKVILLGDCGRLEKYPVFERLFAEYEKRWPGGGWKSVTF